MSLARVHDRLTATIGLDPSTLSRTAVAGEIGRRMRACDVVSLTAYADLLEHDTAEFDRLASALLVHETSFFRYPAAFTLLAQEAREPTPRGVPYRVHSVACATGEEASSIVIALLEAGLEPARVHVDATDLSREALARARAGRYGGRVVRQVPAPLRERYFRPEAETWLLQDVVRERIRYHEANVLSASFGKPAARYGAVFCRNLLIYLVPDARRVLLDKLVAMLEPGGLLFVGHAEVAAVRERGLALAMPADAFACRLLPAAARPARPPVALAGRRRLPAPPPPASVPAPPLPPSRSTSTSTRPAPPPLPPPLPPPTFAPATLRRAAALADAGELLEARQLLNAAIGGGLACSDHYHLLALVESALSREDASEQALIKALYLDPQHYPALAQLALVADQRGERQRARRLREKAERVRAAWETGNARRTEVGHGDA